MIAPFSLDDQAERSPSDQRSVIKYGLSWQVVPNKWDEGGKDAVGMQRLNACIDAGEENRYRSARARVQRRTG